MGVPKVRSSGRASIIEGDCIEVMRLAAEESFDAVVTDPPYNLEFMGHGWDRVADYQKWCEAWGREAWWLLKPGAHLFAFGGTRTAHRLAAGLEDAGFEIRDSIAWIYAQGMPKSPSQLRPSFEPIVVARKPLDGSQKANVARWGTGALNTAAGRTAAGRWPANVALDEVAAAEVDAVSGNRPGVRTQTLNRGSTTGRSIGGKVYGTAAPQVAQIGYDDEGGASRFFYTSKAGKDERVTVNGVTHPTVKPLDLIRWLVRMGCPPGGRVLDMFAGSGTTGVACLLEGMSCVLVDNEPTYIPLIVQRLEEVP